MKSRVTFKNPDGSWGLKNGYEMQKVPEELYGPLCKLLDYEETGVNPNDIELIKELQEAAVRKVDEAREEICDKYCRYPTIYVSGEDAELLEAECDKCPLGKM